MLCFFVTLIVYIHICRQRRGISPRMFSHRRHSYTCAPFATKKSLHLLLCWCFSMCGGWWVCFDNVLLLQASKHHPCPMFDVIHMHWCCVTTWRIWFLLCNLTDPCPCPIAQSPFLATIFGSVKMSKFERQPNSTYCRIRLVVIEFGVVLRVHMWDRTLACYPTRPAKSRYMLSLGAVWPWCCKSTVSYSRISLSNGNLCPARCPACRPLRFIVSTWVEMPVQHLVHQPELFA